MGLRAVEYLGDEGCEPGGVRPDLTAHPSTESHKQGQINRIESILKDRQLSREEREKLERNLKEYRLQQDPATFRAAEEQEADQRRRMNRLFEGVRAVAQGIDYVKSGIEIGVGIVSEPVDLALAITYLTREPGNWRNWAAALPFVPSAVARHAFQAGGVAGRHAGEVIGKAYSSRVLSKNIETTGLVRGQSQHAHHVVGNSKKTCELVKELKTRGIDFDVNESLNGMFIDAEFHRQVFNNPRYRQYVDSAIARVNDRATLSKRIEAIKIETLRAQEQWRRHRRAATPWD